jgi:hypothetical protein
MTVSYGLLFKLVNFSVKKIFWGIYFISKICVKIKNKKFHFGDRTWNNNIDFVKFVQISLFYFLIPISY